MVEIGGRSAEDEVHGSFDVTVIEVLATRLGQQRVLIPQEAAVPKNAAIAHDRQRESLALGTGGIVEGEVFGGEIIGLNEYGGCIEGDQRPAVGSGKSGMEIVGDDGGSRIVAAQREEDFIGRHDHALLINAGADVNHKATASMGRRRIDSRLHGPELAASVGRDHRIRAHRAGRDQKC
jgi:hypothetical protein